MDLNLRYEYERSRDHFLGRAHLTRLLFWSKLGSYDESYKSRDKITEFALLTQLKAFKVRRLSVPH